MSGPMSGPIAVRHTNAGSASHLSPKDSTFAGRWGQAPAIILKSFAWADRHRQIQQDAIDLSNVFAVLRHHGPETIGGLWRLNETERQGRRRDAAANLHMGLVWRRRGDLNPWAPCGASTLAGWCTRPNYATSPCALASGRTTTSITGDRCGDESLPGERTSTSSASRGQGR